MSVAIIFSISLLTRIHMSTLKRSVTYTDRSLLPHSVTKIKKAKVCVWFKMLFNHLHKKLTIWRCLLKKKSLWFNFLIDFLLQTLLKKAILLHFMSFQTERNFISTTKIVSNILLKGPSQPYLCFCSHLRVWLQSLYFILSMSKWRQSLWNNYK